MTTTNLSRYLESPGPGGEILRTALRPLPFVVGRGESCDLVLDSRHTSQRHAEFFSREDDLWLRDLASTNGTWINDRRLDGEDLVGDGDVVRFADRRFRLVTEAAAPPMQQTLVFSRSDRMRLEEIVRQPQAFRAMLRDGTLRTDFQPLVQLADRRTVAYEALGRGTLDGREASPGDLFFLAEKLGREIELSAAFRARGAQLAESFDGAPEIFVNTHPGEIEDLELLLRSLELLRKRHPSLRLVLEVHEAAVADVPTLRDLRVRLDALDMGLAFDDFGRGQSRLLELGDVTPRYVKFDAVMIQGIHLTSEARRRRVVGELVEQSRKMGVVTIAECIESAEEAAACFDLGFEMGQGYHFGAPAAPAELGA